MAIGLAVLGVGVAVGGVAALKGTAAPTPQPANPLANVNPTTSAPPVQFAPPAVKTVVPVVVPPKDSGPAQQKNAEEKDAEKKKQQIEKKKKDTGGGIPSQLGVAVAVTQFNAAIGTLITGDSLGGLGGALGTLTLVSGGNAITAQAGNIGRVLGRDLDRILMNGDGSNVTSVVLQAAGFWLGFMAGAAGLTWLPFIGQLFGIVVAVTAAIDDASKLAFGQRGARNQTVGSLQRLLGDTRAKMLEQVQKEFGVSFEQMQPEDRAQVEGSARAFVRGYFLQRDITRELAWSKHPRGITLTLEQHMQFGRDRGYFIVDRASVLAEALGGTFDGQFEGAQRAGRIAGNTADYLAAMNQPQGLGQDLTRHAAYWRNVGAFQGTLEGPNVRFEGVLIDFQASKTSGALVARS
jgi:hypothetical protein